MTGRDQLLKKGLTAAKKNNYNGIFLMPTGSGKGRLMIELAKILKPKSILYVCDSRALRDKMFIDELHKWDAAHLLNIMDLECYQTVYKWKDKTYDLVLGDEFDASLTPEYMKVWQNNTFKNKILVSATLDDTKRKIAKKIAPIIFEVTPNELVKNKVLNSIQFYFIHYDLTERENYKYLEFNKQFKVLLNQYQNSLTKFQLEKLQIQRKQFLSKLDSSAEVTKWLIKSLKNRKEKILIFCGLSEQADRISKNSYHSNNNNYEALVNFDKGLIDELAVVEKITRGVNVAEIRNIILESFGKSKTKMTQKIGRGMRLGVNDILNVFILIPFFKHPFHGRRATVVENWVIESTKDMDLSNAKIVNYKS